MRRSFHHRQFTAPRLLSAKRGRRVSVCLPARNEEATVGAMITRIREELIERWPLVDELVVMDDGSTDTTAKVATHSGAIVLDTREVLPEYGGSPGKGQAMWKAVHVATGDVVVFCDADIAGFDPAFVLGLLGPLLMRDDVSFVKGFYERPLDGRPGEGGRVTELMAKPLIATFFPHLSDLLQPLSGECAALREVFEMVPFVGGYGVDLGLLIDVTAKFGNSSLVQSDLGVRVHRNRPLADLGPQALAVLQTALSRAGVSGWEWGTSLVRAGADPVVVAFSEQPPLCEVPAHRMTA